VLLGVAAREPMLRTRRWDLALVPLGLAAERLRGGDVVQLEGGRRRFSMETRFERRPASWDFLRKIADVTPFTWPIAPDFSTRMAFS